jgi:hypothetical protein
MGGFAVLALGDDLLVGMISLTFDLRTFQPQAKLKTVIGKLRWGNGTSQAVPR